MIWLKNPRKVRYRTFQLSRNQPRGHVGIVRVRRRGGGHGVALMPGDAGHKRRRRVAGMRGKELASRAGREFGAVIAYVATNSSRHPDELYSSNFVS